MAATLKRDERISAVVLWLLVGRPAGLSGGCDFWNDMVTYG